MTGLCTRYVVRGVYDTLREAQVRAKVLQRRDPNFNVFVGQVGYWLPWDPHPHRIENQEYGEQELNELVKSYRENQEKKDLHFQENIDYVKEQAAKKNAKQKEETAKQKESDDNEDVVNKVSDEVKNSLNDIDPWLKNKMEKKD